MRHVSQTARRVWFRYAYAALLLTAGLARRDTAAGAGYAAAAAGLTFAAACCRCGEPASWRLT